jgi:hypothetical protein
MSLGKHIARNRKWVLRGAVALSLVAALGVAASASWTRIAIASAPAKTAASARDPAALKADEVFWQTFHGGKYDQIQPALDQLTAAYLKTPSDAVTAAHIGWLHTWRVAERARDPEATATITDHVVVGRKYFHEALMLDPGEARYLGFLAAETLSEARIDQDERLTREGYFMLQDSVKAWPEFNLFTAGYLMSGLSPESPQFKEGLEYQWKNMDVCVGEPVDRATPDYSRFMPLDTKTGKKRTCWNSWIAPHNLEGFFLNMGDMLVKTGDVKTARAIYENAKASKEYAAWRYQDVLEDRIAHAQDNVAAFNRPDAAKTTPMMIDSKFACMACHLE